MGFSRMGKGTGGVVDVVLSRRYTRNPESPPLQIDIPIFIFFLPQTELVKFLLNFFELFLTSLSFFFFLFKIWYLLPFLFSFFCSKQGKGEKDIHVGRKYHILNRKKKKEREVRKSSKYGISFLHVYPFPLFLVFWPSRAQP